MNWKLLTSLALATATLSSSAYEFVVDTDPSNGFGVIDASTTVIEGQSFQVDVYLKKESGDAPVDAYGITVEFNSSGVVLGLDGATPVSAYGLNPGADKYALDGVTIDDPYDLDPGTFSSFISLPTNTGGTVVLQNTGGALPSPDSVNGFDFTHNSGGEGIYSLSKTPFDFNVDEYILLQAVSFVASAQGVTDIGVAGVFNGFAAGDTSNPHGVAGANVNQAANAFALFDSTSPYDGFSRAVGVDFVNGTITVTAVPEPSTFSLFALCAGIWLCRKRQA